MTHLLAEERVQHPTLAAGNGGHVDVKAAPDLPREGHLQEKGRQPSVAAVVSRRDRAAGKTKEVPARHASCIVPETGAMEKTRK